jgi:hypothetical protein
LTANLGTHVSPEGVQHASEFRLSPMLRGVFRQHQLTARHQQIGVSIGVWVGFPGLVKDELVQISQGNDTPAETVELFEHLEQAECHAHSV